MKHTISIFMFIIFSLNLHVLAETDPGADVSARLELNDGKKWLVHDHMYLNLLKMETTLYLSSPPKSTNSAQALAHDLQKEIGELVSNCTMSGPAHDQLHIFLTALFPEVEKLEKQNDTNDLQVTKRNLDELFKVYRTFFEKAGTAPN